MASLTQLKYFAISYNKFSGSIPNFSMCKNLTTVRLYNNYLSSEIISTQWEKLLNLEILELDSNLLNGNIPDSLFSHPSLQVLYLSNNQFSGQLKEFSNASSFLEILYLDNNQLEGPIPMSIFELHGLRDLSLGSNKFNNSLNLSVIQQLKNLSYLDLSHTSLLSEYNDFNFSLSSVPLYRLNLASCKLKKIPDFLRNQSYLSYLDLSHNQIFGEMPNWIWKLPNLYGLDLSYNFLETLEGPILNVSLYSPNLRSNQLRGQLPIISYVEYLDFSGNSLHSSILANISRSFPSIGFLFLSSSKIYGSIPISICNATNLKLLDLSKNSISGTIPECLIEMSDKLWMLDLRRNKLNGTIPDAFPDNCTLQSLALNKNQLEGGLPKSLANCIRLEVLDIGKNHIEDTFPIYLKNTSMLRVLVLRSNKFYGPIAHPKLNAPWPILQIVDLASNNFIGNLPIIILSSLMAMMDREHEAQSELDYLRITINGSSYEDTITVTNKGLEVELVKILTIFTTLDLSCNNFDGPIPEKIGELKALHSLNLSHNAFTGKIPSSLGKLNNLETLDLSCNELSSKIPVQLADGLIFLSTLNLSFNQLVGQIPFIKQFATFSESSFKGNDRLCGLPLKSQCTYKEPRLLPPTHDEKHWKSGIVIKWNYISVEFGFIFGIGIVIGPLVFWKRWRIWYYKQVDDILFKIFPRLYLRIEYRQRRRYRNQRQRHQS
ncbi:receptor like protein 24-like [Corylus avellana]|uniref:receptor like protein 24-like n=1 Tax=Corylus avellana TaxID=13451 RepID=UPI00286A8585|nr:receptor like protein 24-like [Corylus avellana]